MSPAERRGGAWPVILAVVVALVASLLIARADRPPGVFPKYRAIAAMEGASRVQDVSPLYLALTRWTLDAGPRGMLLLQCGAHAATAALLAWIAGRLAGPRAALAAGLLAALHAPFLVAAGTHEPETFLQLALAGAMACGVAAAGSPRAAAWSLGSGALIAAAALLRPQHLLLVPAWMAWAWWTLPKDRRARAALAVAAGFALALAPHWITRERGVPTTMNPAVVLYEGNWPMASGLARVAPPLVKELERRHPEALDYGHVAYRRLAAFEDPGAEEARGANAFWAQRLVEGLKAHPGDAARRFARKLAHALAPHEIHDLRSMEDLSRRVRQWLPWGFLPLAGMLAWIPLARRERLRELAGPLAVAGLAIAVQLAFYASARQRLPLATASIVIVAVIAADVGAGRLRVPIRKGLAVAMACALALTLVELTGRDALVDQAQWDLAGARPARGPGEAIAAIADGRLLRTRSEHEIVGTIVTGADAADRGGTPGAELRALEGRGIDLTIDDLDVLVPEAILARTETDPARRAALARAALALRPGDPRVAAPAWAAEDAPKSVSTALAARPPGTDAATWLWLCARESGRPELLQPLLDDFPELRPRSIEP